VGVNHQTLMGRRARGWGGGEGTVTNQGVCGWKGHSVSLCSTFNAVQSTPYAAAYTQLPQHNAGVAGWYSCRPAQQTSRSSSAFGSVWQ
jgi:hypothetical protein